MEGDTTPTKRDEERARELVNDVAITFESDSVECWISDLVLVIAQALTAAREEGRREGIEEAAKVCHSITQRGVPLFPEHAIDTSEWLSEICATKIRALLDGDEAEEKKE